MTHNPIQPAELNWQQGVPYNRQFGDIYFSRTGGLAEARYIFLQQNDLPARWANTRRFTIAETGFGTGLNFLATVQAWEQTTPAGARLYYLSIEKFPLSRADLARAMEAWPELAAAAAGLLAVYPERVPGVHRCELLGGRVVLYLCFGDVAEVVPQWQARVDAWYLDGFAPGKNPDMWQDSLYARMARLSSPQATFATFTAAGFVRRGLQAAGFAVSKVPGFGGKRESLRGILRETVEEVDEAPWYRLPTYAPGERRAIIIGAGLAGGASAWMLAQQGWQVTVVERHDKPAMEASGNLAGVVMPRLSRDHDAASRFYLQAFLAAGRFWAGLDSEAWQPSGVLQLMDRRKAEGLLELGLPESLLHWLEPDEAALRIGLKVARGGVWFPRGGWAQPGPLCRELLAGPAIELRYGCAVAGLERGGEGWLLRDDTGAVIDTAPVVIIANGAGLAGLSPLAELPLSAVRGQLVYLPATPSEGLRAPVCYDGYVTPAVAGHHCVGATFEPERVDLQWDEGEADKLLHALGRELPHWEGASAKGLSGRVARRSVSPDRLPLLGPAPDAAFYADAYAELRHGRPASSYPQARYHEGLFVNAAHGARGLVSCVAAAQWLADYLEGAPVGLPRDVMQAVHPARFWIRRLRRASRF